MARNCPTLHGSCTAIVADAACRRSHNAISLFVPAVRHEDRRGSSEGLYVGEVGEAAAPVAANKAMQNFSEPRGAAASEVKDASVDALRRQGLRLDWLVALIFSLNLYAWKAEDMFSFLSSSAIGGESDPSTALLPR